MPDTVIGCKRLCVDTGYYATFNRPNVHLVDSARDADRGDHPGGIRTCGHEHELDAIVFATGFDAMTGALLADRHQGSRRADRCATRGRPGRARTSASASPASRTCSSSPVPAAPRCSRTWSCRSSTTSSGSPTASPTCASTGCARSRPRLDAQDQWVDYVNMVADFTLFPSCNSWYLGANVPGKPRVFMPLLGFPPYVERCNEVAAKGYEGFALQA